MPETEIRPRLRFAIDRSAKLSQTPGQSGTIPARQYTVIQSISLFAFDQDDISVSKSASIGPMRRRFHPIEPHRHIKCCRSLSVCLSVTILYCVKTARHLAELLPPSDSRINLAFPAAVNVVSSLNEPQGQGQTTDHNFMMLKDNQKTKNIM